MLTTQIPPNMSLLGSFGDPDDSEATQLFELRAPTEGATETVGGKAKNSSPYSSMKVRRSRRRRPNPWDVPASDDENDLDHVDDTDGYGEVDGDSDTELLDLGAKSFWFLFNTVAHHSV
jgi:hypothetical protein